MYPFLSFYPSIAHVPPLSSFAVKWRSHIFHLASSIVALSSLVLVLSSFFFLLSATPLYAATYYVDATSGQDTYAGLSQTASWKTIAKVNASRFNPGDQVLFKKGETWREQLTVPSSGSAGKPITFGAYGDGNRPIINGSDLITTWTRATSNIYQATLTAQPIQVFFNGTRGIMTASIATVNAANKWFWASNVLYIYSTSDPDTAYTSPGIQVGKRDMCIYLLNKDYITIDGLILEAANLINVGVCGTSDHSITRNSEIRYAGMYGISWRERVGARNYIDTCLIHHNAVFGVQTYKHTGSGRGTESYIQNNEFYNNTQVGISLRGNYTIIQNNNIHDNGSDGIHNALHIVSEEEGTGHNNTVRYNKIYNQIGGIYDGAGIAVDYGCDDNSIYYNLIYNNYGKSIWVNNAANVHIYNNVFYGNVQNPSQNTKAEISLSSSTSWPGGPTTAAVKNNIARATSADTYAISVDALTSANTLDITNNDWYSAATNWYFWNNAGGNDLSIWNALTGIGADLNSDPLFTNVLSYDLHLQPTSPAINAGVDVGLTQDYDGHGVVGPPDIGAYDHHSGFLKP